MNNFEIEKLMENFNIYWTHIILLDPCNLPELK